MAVLIVAGLKHMHSVCSPGSGLLLLASREHSWEFSSTFGGHIGLWGTQADGTLLEVGLGAGGECRVTFSVFSPTPRPSCVCSHRIRRRNPGHVVLVFLELPSSRTRPPGAFCSRGPLHSEGRQALLTFPRRSLQNMPLGSTYQASLPLCHTLSPPHILFAPGKFSRRLATGCFVSMKRSRRRVPYTG